MTEENVLRSFQGKKVLITGGTGLIGRQVVDILDKAGVDVKIVSLDKIKSAGIINNLKEKVFSFVLFGSVAEGKDDLNSDYDFLIIGKNKSEIKKIFSEFEDKFNREINLHIFTLEEWKEQAKTNKAFYQDIIAKGVCLMGEKPIIN